ncbi:MAG: toll/interleukin-1 receptor domain-containing protein [Bacteroidales bacterium]|nr:toll/interleukin-1 receptor domain-containing protein [Bacteroidales bacterium]
MEKTRIFISHCLDDKAKIDDMKIFNDEHFDCYFAEESYCIGKTISEKIAKEIDSREYFFLILTKKSQKSPFVNQEFGYAKAKDKKIVIIKESKNIKQEGFLHGLDYLDASKDLTMDKIMSIVAKDSKKEVNNLSKSSIDKIVIKNDYLIQQNDVITYKNEDNNKDLLVALGCLLVGLLIILAAKKS